MEIIKLTPACKSYIWGGRRLIENYSKVTDEQTLSETWELSFHPDGPTLADGVPLSELVTDKELGKNACDFEGFPQLIKLIDARDDLSIQVHPSDEYALAHENSYGKTEAWYIVDAQEGAGIYLGFNRDMTKDMLESAIQSNTLTDYLNFYEVKKGECYFIPAGTVHAIAKGCLICEVQQNSNITYRVYDYGRRDKNGNTRELHVEKAKEVILLDKFKPLSPCDTALARCKYFEMRMADSSLYADKNSFLFAICLAGEGTVGNVAVKQGDSLLIPAGYGEVTLSGDMQVLTSSVRKYVIGIDVGGTFIKGGITDDNGNIIVSDKIPTPSDEDGVVSGIAGLCKSLCSSAGLSLCDCVGIGMGVPGTVDTKTGVVRYSNNLGWKNVAISEKLSALTGLPVKIANDANVAALGEALFGCGKQYKTTVMLTLGTGVGGGIVIDGRLYDGNRGAGAEMGHAVIMMDGEQCTCGRRGCLEAYASATALIRDTKRAIASHPDSLMAKEKEIDGATAFKYADRDPYAKTVVDNYIKYLACGITNLANEFRPDAVILGGGVCNEGERLILPLQDILDREIFGSEHSPRVKIITAELGNRAGLLGGAALWFC